MDCVDTVREENEPAIKRSRNSECTQMIDFQYGLYCVCVQYMQVQLKNMQFQSLYCDFEKALSIKTLPTLQ